MAPQI